MPDRPATHKPFAAAQAAGVRPHKAADSRPSSHARGYTRRWQQFRLYYLAQHPLCVVEGCNRPATDVDHVQAVSGPDDPRFYDETNLQALCHSHHSAKTAREDGGRPRRRGAGG